MRIIAGEFRGRNLLAPVSQVTRPITDRVKQSLFDILTPQIQDAMVYDLFAGTGSLGLEALSRGAQRAIFFELDRSALARLSQNITALGLGDRSTIIPGDLFKWFRRAVMHPGGPGTTHAHISPADILFLDPPYRFVTDRGNELLQLALHLTRNSLKPGATVIFRHDPKAALQLPRLLRREIRDYGSMVLEFLTPAV
jgi:16S rRNA (guanine966-N2)-methyltransferase